MRSSPHSRKKKKNWLQIILRFIVRAFIIVILILFLFFLYLHFGINPPPPTVTDMSPLEKERTELDSTTFTLGNNWFRKSNSGLYEMYVEGQPFERGVAYGKLTQELVQRQEDHFTAQFLKMVPSKSFMYLLKYGIKWFNRNMLDYVPLEYQQEIYGVSFAASDKYNYIGKKFHRILNYHAAHDIGHAIQNLALVGCTSFATWDGASEDSSLIVGRNFDFYVGDEFAEEKIIAFYKPTDGYRFAMVTWAGFTGVVSGMNDQGLTVTINAAKSAIPSRSATPVSLVAREILQYAKNIKEAEAIAAKRTMFVSESFLIGSALDGHAAIIEKTPEQVGLYESSDSILLCTNHFQSALLDKSAPNEIQKANSASIYRYERLQEVLANNPTNSVEKTVNILRDVKGLKNSDIGMGNEKAINQLIAHHSIVFQPEKLRFWVSTSPWQLGEFVAYDLNEIFNIKKIVPGIEIMDDSLNVSQDSLMNTKAFQGFITFRNLKKSIQNEENVDINKLIESNPNYYHTYVLAGDYVFKENKYEEAYSYYKMGLTKEIATVGEKNYILDQIEKCVEKGNLKI